MGSVRLSVHTGLVAHGGMHTKETDKERFHQLQGIALENFMLFNTMPPL